MSTSLENYRFFPPLFPFFIVWIESNKDSFLFDVIKLLRPDLGVRVNFFPKHRRELSDFRCQTLFQASQHLVFPPQVKGRFEEEEKKKQNTPLSVLTARHLHPHSFSGLIVLLILTPGSLKPLIAQLSKLPTCSPVSLPPLRR